MGDDQNIPSKPGQKKTSIEILYLEQQPIFFTKRSRKVNEDFRILKRNDANWGSTMAGGASACDLPSQISSAKSSKLTSGSLLSIRSEERRVGKECRLRWWT